MFPGRAYSSEAPSLEKISEKKHLHFSVEVCI